MPNRLFLGNPLRLMLLCLLFLAGCAGATQERLDKAEASIDEFRAQEIRLALLEDKIAALNAEVTALKAPALQEEKGSATKPELASRSRSAAVSSGALAVPVGGSSGVKSSSPAADKAYQKALATFEAGRPEAALTQFSEFLKTYPASPLAPNAGYWLGECYYSQKRFDTAIITFKDVVAKYPRHPKAAAAMLKAGLAYARLGDKDNARFYLETLIQDFPDSEPAKLARGRISSL